MSRIESSPVTPGESGSPPLPGTPSERPLLSHRNRLLGVIAERLVKVTPRFGAGRIALVVFGATFLFRWLTVDFDNEYFMHLAWAAEMLRGDWPVRDFVEPGFPLQTGLAYLGFRVGGYQLLWEGLIASAMVALGATFTYLACLRLGLSRGWALAATLVAVAAYPRLYAYPKAVAYPAAVWALARYTTRPTTSELVVAGVVTGTAFLLRHDHGVYTALALVIGMGLYHRLDVRGYVKALAVCGSVAAVVVAPWGLWVLASGHADQYWRFLTSQSGGLVGRQRAPEVSIDVDRSQPLIAVAPIEYPLVGIRWASTASAADRRDRELRYGLVAAEGEERYRLTNPDVSNVRALVQDPLVEDTSGIDRGSLRVPGALFPWSYLQMQRYVPVTRVRLFPGALNASNALPWLAWVSFALPAIALAILLLDVIRRSAAPSTTSVIVATAVLSAITYQTLVRGSPDSRLGDIAGTTGILLAWASWRLWGMRPRLLIRSLTVAGLGLTFLAAVTFGRGVDRLAIGGVDGPTNLVRRVRSVAERYGSRPLDVFAPPGFPGLPSLGRWLNACTAESSRVAVLGFEPQLFVLSERGLAGGVAFYDIGWFGAEADQRLTLERWSRQDVPAVIAMESEWGSFSRDYALVRAYIEQEYEVAQRSSFGGSKEVSIFIRKSALPAGVDATTGLPCFR
jgi:hypothetical protein